MTRIRVIVEGQTEEAFISNILGPTLFARQVFLSPIILGSPRHRGGNTNYARVRKDIVVSLKQDETAYCSTMIDFYGLGVGFPGHPLPPNLPNIEKVNRIEQAIKADILTEAGILRSEVRFVPYLQLHEYEGLLFSDPAAFARGINQNHLVQPFQTIRGKFATPEDINDDVNTAPSKRVLDHYPAYKKVLDGTLAAKAVGIEKMRSECPHFREWIQRLEALANP